MDNNNNSTVHNEELLKTQKEISSSLSAIIVHLKKENKRQSSNTGTLESFFDNSQSKISRSAQTSSVRSFIESTADKKSFSSYNDEDNTTLAKKIAEYITIAPITVAIAKDINDISSEIYKIPDDKSESNIAKDIEIRREELKRKKADTERLVQSIEDINGTLKEAIKNGSLSGSSNDRGGLGFGAGMGMKSLGMGLGGLGVGIGKLGVGLGVAVGSIGVGVGAGAGAAGLGISYALQAIGSSFSTFTDGLKTFEGLDTAKLQNSGDAMFGMSKGLAALSGAKVLDSLGNFIALPFDKLTELFSGEDRESRLAKIFGELETFSQYKLDSASIENNANALTAYGRAMSTEGIGKMSQAAGDFLSGTIGELGKFLGSGDSMENLQKFGELEINTAGVARNAESTIIFGQAMTRLGAAKGSAAWGDLGEGLIGGLGKLFGSEDSMEKLVRFGNLPVNLTGVQNNADATVAFGQAMNRLSGVTAIGSIASTMQAIGDSLLVLSGSKDPLQKLKEFGDLEVDVEGVQNSAKGIKEYVSSFLILQGLKVTEGLADSINSIITVGGLLSSSSSSGETIFTQMERFGNLKVNKQDIENSSEALQAYTDSFRMLNWLSVKEKTFGALNSIITLGGLLSSKSSSEDGVLTRWKDLVLHL